MKKSTLGIIIGVVTFASAVAAAITAFLLINEKKKRDEEELERYLDCSIQ